MPPPPADSALIAEAKRVYLRYAVEIVEALGFCPYAERARLDGKTRELVVAAGSPTDAQILAQIEEVSADESLDLAVVILPRLTIGRHDLDRRVEALRKLHTARNGGAAKLAIEGFHPDADADTESPERLTPFIRRTPDPTLQLTRLAALERVRRGTPTGTAFFDPSSMDLEALLAEPGKRPLHAQIAEMNHAEIMRRGVAAVRARMDAILHDRDESYRAVEPSIPRRSVPDQSSGSGSE